MSTDDYPVTHEDAHRRLSEEEQQALDRRAESVVGCKQVFFVFMDAAVLACSFPRPTVVVKCDQLYTEIEKSERFFMTLARKCFVLCCKTVEDRYRKSRDLLQTGEFTSGDKVTQVCFCRDSFQFGCMRIVAHLFLRVSSMSAHGSGRDSYLGRCV